ncbi:MAG: N-acetyl sugar amidotransferase [Gammaproteobacteria bacterium]|nr:N-acetyl sugar amidotransferase [Gammaproteobacteria bacterium]
MNKTYQICKRCVMDTSVADIEFDVHGECNYCRAASARLERELYVGDDHGAKLAALIGEIKREGVGKPYDCIIGVSGGVDSSYTAYLVKRKYGLRPLAIHFDNGWNSELAVQNIERLLNSLEIDLHTHVVDWDEFKDLQLSFLKASVANCEIPTDHAIVALMYRMADKHGVRHIISGGNLATESIMPDVWMHDAKDLRFIRAIQRRFGNRRLKSTPLMGYAKLAWYVLMRRIRYVGILNYVDFNKDEATRILEEELGWRKYQAKHFESIYTRFFQGYLLPKKFNMDKRRPHLSSMIVSGQITRDEALAELAGEPYDPKIAADDIEYIRQKFGLSESQFDAIMKSPVKTSDDYPNSEHLLRSLAPLVAWIKSVATGRRSA